MVILHVPLRKCPCGTQAVGWLHRLISKSEIHEISPNIFSVSQMGGGVCMQKKGLHPVHK